MKLLITLNPQSGSRELKGTLGGLSTLNDQFPVKQLHFPQVPAGDHMFKHRSLRGHVLDLSDQNGRTGEMHQCARVVVA